MKTWADRSCVLCCLKGNLSRQISFCDAADAHFEITFSSGFHHPEKTMNINKLFWWSTKLKGVADVID